MINLMFILVYFSLSNNKINYKDIIKYIPPKLIINNVKPVEIKEENYFEYLLPYEKEFIYVVYLKNKCNFLNKKYYRKNNKTNEIEYYTNLLLKDKFSFKERIPRRCKYYLPKGIESIVKKYKVITFERYLPFEVHIFGTVEQKIEKISYFIEPKKQKLVYIGKQILVTETFSPKISIKKRINNWFLINKEKVFFNKKIDKNNIIKISKKILFELGGYYEDNSNYNVVYKETQGSYEIKICYNNKNQNNTLGSGDNIIIIFSKEKGVVKNIFVSAW